MAKFKVAIIVGSLRRDSINLKLGKAIAKLGQDKFETKFLSIDLPLFNQDMEANFPEAVTIMKNGISEADAVLVVTPEYNRSVPGPLKNAIDWCSRPYGNNSFAKKPVAVCGASLGAIGTACSQAILKSTLSHLDTVLMGQPELYLHFTDSLIDSDGNIANENTQKFLQKFVDGFSAWVAQHTANTAARAA